MKFWVCPLRVFLRAARLCMVVFAGGSTLLISQPTHKPSTAEQEAVQRNFNLLPLRFEPNQGQSASDAKFLAQGPGFAVLFKGIETDFLFASHAAARSLLRVSLLNASAGAKASGEKRLPGTVNYFLGNDRDKWHTGVPTYERLRYAGVYPGTDLIYYGNKGSLEFDFQLSPGASPNRIQMRFAGARSLRIDSQGNLIVTAKDGHVTLQKPVIYQPGENGRKDLVAGSFRILNNNTAGFAMARYDRSRPLVIDPILNYSTYIGVLAQANAIAVDQNGEAYVTGVATLDFPTTPGSYQPVGVPSSTASGYWPEGGKPFVAKFNSTGTALLYSTFLSGSGVDVANGIALDANGDAFVAGTTSSSDFPITPGAAQPKNMSAGTTGFVAELSSTGSSLSYSTYLGGNTSTIVNGIAVDGSESAYLTGSTEDANFPTTQGAYQTTALTKTSGGLSSAFVAKLNPTGTALVYSTYLGGNQTDAAFAIAVDSAGEAYVGGDTTSNNFPVTAGAVQGAREASNQQAGFVTKFNATGSALAYSTYLSGKALDYLTALAVDANGNAYATGTTTSPDFPVTAGAFQSNIGITYFNYPQYNAYVSELNSTGTSLVYSTFLGGGLSLGVYADQGDGGKGIAVDGQGAVYVTGSACTEDFPVTAGAFEPQNLDGEIDGECTAFLTKMKPAPNTPLLYSTFLGGTGNGDPGDYFTGEEGYGLALDSSGNVYLAGFTLSIDFPVTAGVVETAFTGNSEKAFVTEFNGSEMKSLPVPTVTLASNLSSVLFGQPVTFTATVQPASGTAPATGYVGFDFFGLQASDDEGLSIGFGPWTTVPLNGAGVATFTTSSLVALQTQVNAFYLGDANNAPATGTMTQTVTDIATTTTITASPNNVPYGTPITFTITVVDQYGNPVQGSALSGYGGLGGWVTLNSNGQGTWTDSTLPVGTTSVYAQLTPPPTGYATSEGTVNVTVTPLGTTPPPLLTPPAGTYTSAQQVSPGDSNSAATVYYTTDGSTPVPGVSQSALVGFGFTIPVNASETVNAVAVAPGYSPSSMVSAAYTINLVPDFNLQLSPLSLTVPEVGVGSVSVFVSGVNGFSGAVSFTCSGLPAGATCTFAPASINGSGSSVVTVVTSAATAMNRDHRHSGFLPFTLLAALLGCIRIRRRGVWLLIFIACALPLCALNGCGGGGNGGSSSSPPPPKQPTPGIYAVSVTGTSGSLSHSATVQVTITD